MTATKTNERPGTRAVLKHSGLSASKVRQVLDLIRGQDVDRAAEILIGTEREAANIIGKVLLTEHNLYTRDTINELLDRNMNTVVTARDWRSDTTADVTARCWMAWYIEIGRIIYAAADHITYLYPAAIGEAEGLGSQSSKSEIVPNGTLLTKFQAARDRFTERRNEIRQAAAKPKWRLAYCARLVPIKGLVDLISSVAELVASGETHS